MAKILMKGAEAIAEAAIEAGCQAYFGYPITPQNEVPEYFAKRMPKLGRTFYRPSQSWRQSIWCMERRRPACGL